MSESTHAEHTAAILSELIRSELVGEAATDGAEGWREAAVAAPVAPLQAVMAVSTARAAAVSESTHAEHTAEILSALTRSEFVGAVAMDGGWEVAAVAEPAAPPQAVVVATTTSSVPKRRRVRPQECWRATDSPSSPSAARPYRA